MGNAWDAVPNSARNLRFLSFPPHVSLRDAKDKLDLGSVPGHAYIDGSNLLLVFPVTKLIDMVKAMGSKISSMETIVALLENYKNVYIGFEFSRQAGENAK